MAAGRKTWARQPRGLPWTWRLIGTALVTAGALLAFWRLLGMAPAPGVASGTGVPPGSEASSPGAAGPRMAPAARASSSHGPRDAARGAAAATPGIADDGRPLVDVCGVGRVVLEPNDAYAAVHVVEGRTRGMVDRWLAALLESSDTEARAAGLVLQGVNVAAALPAPSVELARDALVQLALGADDPAVYALALAACGTAAGNAPAGACEGLSVETWAKLDDGNAVPWLLLAGRARARNDGPAEASAFARAASATRVDNYAQSLLQHADAERPTDVSPLTRWYFATQVLGIEASMVPPQYGPALHHCSAEALQDASVRAECDAVAELFVTRARSALDLGAGITLGDRLGWPAPRLETLRREQELVSATTTGIGAADPRDAWSCEQVRRGNEFLDLRDRAGEIGAARMLSL